MPWGLLGRASLTGVLPETPGCGLADNRLQD